MQSVWTLKQSFTIKLNNFKLLCSLSHIEAVCSNIMSLWLVSMETEAIQWRSWIIKNDLIFSTYMCIIYIYCIFLLSFDINKTKRKIRIFIAYDKIHPWFILLGTHEAFSSINLQRIQNTWKLYLILPSYAIFDGYDRIN